MKVAISGTHCCGKSTLIDAFLRANPHFAHEPEPYITLVEDYGEMFGAEPSLDDFYRQLEFSVELLRRYKRGEQVIYERSPVDFLAYMLALGDLDRSSKNSHLVDRSLAAVAGSIQFLDLIVFLPLSDEEDDAAMSESEDPELREAVNCRLIEIFSDDNLGLFNSDRPVVLEASGSTPERLALLERAIGKQQAHRQ